MEDLYSARVYDTLKQIRCSLSVKSQGSFTECHEYSYVVSRSV